VGFGGAELVLHPKGEYIYIRDLNLVLTAKGTVANRDLSR